MRKRRVEYFFPQVYLNYEGELKDDNMTEMKKKKIPTLILSKVIK